jgi:hypothetical protein
MVVTIWADRENFTPKGSNDGALQWCSSRPDNQSGN